MNESNSKNILVLFGGCSTEYEVSLQSAAAVLEHMGPERYRALPVGITRQGRWLRYLGPTSALTGERWQQENCVACTLSLNRDDLSLIHISHPASSPSSRSSGTSRTPNIGRFSTVSS